MTVLDEVRALAPEISNWGRWGDKDQRGTLNLLDADAIRRGAEAVVDGVAIALDLPANLDAPRLFGQQTRQPPLRTTLQLNFAWTGDPSVGQFNDDNVSMGVQAVTHWDALSHVGYDNQFYNGFPTSTATVEGGARKCGIDKVGPVVGRGVLIDIARHLDVASMDNGQLVTAAMLDDALAATTASVASGDIVLIRTGQMSKWLGGDPRGYDRGSPGLAVDVVRWLYANNIAAYAIDTQNPDAFPPKDDSVFVPIHLLVLRDLGMIQGQNWNLEALADVCAADGRYTFQLHATPIPITGASGAPVAPVAIR